MTGRKSSCLIGVPTSKLYARTYEQMTAESKSNARTAGRILAGRASSRRASRKRAGAPATKNAVVTHAQVL